MITLALAAILGVTAATQVTWVEEKRVKTEVTQNIKGNFPDFKKAGKDMKKLANAACAEKDYGKAKIDGELRVSGIGITPEGQRQVTMFAIYDCQ